VDKPGVRTDRWMYTSGEKSATCQWRASPEEGQKKPTSYPMTSNEGGSRVPMMEQVNNDSMKRRKEKKE